MRSTTQQAAEIRSDFRSTFDSYDKWYCVTGALFDVAETLHARGEYPPESWESHPGRGAFEVADWLDDYDTITLKDFGNALNRWTEMLRAQGEPY